MDTKALSLPILISLVVGNMIGTGIYVLPASLAQYGASSLIAWVYTSFGAMFIALTFARLTQRFPKTGGPYVYCKHAYGKMLGFTVAYTYWLSNLVSIAGIVIASVGYLGFITPVLNANTASYHPYVALAIELGIIWLFTFINLIGIHTAGVVQLWLTVIKIAPLVLITLAGIGSMHLANFSLPSTAVHPSMFTAVSSAAALTFWAFIGLETATVPAENTQGHHDISIATVFGTLGTSFIYIASSAVIMGMLPMTELKNSQFPFAIAGNQLFGPHSAMLIAACAFISGLGALNACTLIQGQIVFAAARDHLFPRAFARLSRHDVPIAGQLLSCSIVTLLLVFSIQPSLLNQFNYIALLAGLLTLLTYFATTMAELKFVASSHPSFLKAVFSKASIVPLLAVAYSLWMIFSFDLSTIEVSILLILLCVPIYFFTVRKYT